jgi:hypothetical protein
MTLPTTRRTPRTSVNRHRKTGSEILIFESRNKSQRSKVSKFSDSTLLEGPASSSIPLRRIPDFEIWISQETPCAFPDVRYNFPSARALPRAGRRAPRKRADFSSAAQSTGKRQTGAINKNDGFSLTPCRRPGDNLFCNIIFV